MLCLLCCLGSGLNVISKCPIPNLALKNVISFVGSICPAEMSWVDVKSVVCSFSSQFSLLSTLCSVTTRSSFLSASLGLPRAFKFSVVWADVFFNMTIVAKHAKPIGIQKPEQTSHRSLECAFLYNIGAILREA
jgi:hypothetical protein